MKKIKINKVRILSITIFLVTLIILIVKIIKNDNSVIQSQYQAGTDDGSELVSNYIKEGVQVGGIVGKLKTLDTSDATATPEDITKGKTAYVNGVKITGTYEVKENPVITGLSASGNSITIQATAGTSNIVGYSTSTTSSTPYYFTTVSPTQSLNVTVSGLNYDTLYYVWVKDEDGLISDYSSIRTEAMVTIPALTQYNTTFTPNITYWTNQSVTVRVSTSVYGYTLQTATSNPSIESSWSNTSTQTLSANGTIYARLTDGEHTGSYTSYNVTNIDTTLPRYLGKGRITISRNNSQRRVVLQLNTIADADSGIAKVVYYYKKDTDSYFTASDPINYATINGTEKGPNGDLYYSCIANFDSDITNNTVYMYAKIYDVAGNVINTALATISSDATSTSYGDAPYED